MVLLIIRREKVEDKIELGEKIRNLVVDMLSLIFLLDIYKWRCLGGRGEMSLEFGKEVFVMRLMFGYVWDLLVCGWYLNVWD